MKIIADQDIPLVQHYFGGLGELQLLPGRAMTHQDILDADILIVRSVTRVDEALLKNSRVKFVGTVGTGTDHLDIAWLEDAGITWRAATGCNATAVVEYIVCVIALLQKMQYLTGKKCRAGVVGVGRIGRRVVDTLNKIGFDVIQCDPLRALVEKDFESTPLEIFSDLDLITLHTPLTMHGSHPTYHMIQEAFLKRQKKNCILINTGRGEVIDFNALKMAGQHLLWCLDVWENEPYIDYDILDTALIATPHIAGHSLQGKYRGVQMIYQAALAAKVIPDLLLAPVDYPADKLEFSNQPVDWRDIVLRIFNPGTETERMKEALVSNPNAFDELRKQFNYRHEFGFVEIQGINLREEDREFVRYVSEKSCA